MDEINNGKSKYTLRQSKFYTGVFIVCAYATLGLAYLISLDGHGVFSYLYVSPFTLICVWMAIFSIKWKIEVNGDNITTYYPFRKPYSFTFQDISRIEHGLYLVVYAGSKRVFSVDNRTIGYLFWLDKLKREGVAIDYI